MKQSDRLSYFIQKIFGDSEHFSLEQRFFTGICFFSCLAFFTSLFLNQFISLPSPMKISCLVLGILFLIYYYLSRFKPASIKSYWLLFFPCCLFILPVWFYGGGISGAAMVISIIIVSLSSLVATNRQQISSVITIMIVLAGLFLIEYHYPHLVVQYPTRLDQFIDNYFTIIIAVFISSFITRLIMMNLKMEKEKTLEAKKQLSQSEYLFRTLAQTTSTGIMLYQDEMYIYVNPAAERLSGYGYDELRTMKFWELVIPEQKDMVMEFGKMRQEGKFPPSGYELGIVTKTGEKRLVYVEGNTMEYYGRPAGLVSITDITELKYALMNVEHLKNYLATIFDSMPSILVGVDLDCLVTQWNKQTEQDTGVLSREAIHRSLFEIMPRLVNRQKEIVSAVRNSMIFENIPLITQDGKQKKHEEITVYPIKGEGFEGAVIRIDDVTLKIGMEEMLIQSEKMSSLGSLAAGMAHEINNPLAGMIQNAQLVINRLTRDLPMNHEAAAACGTTMDIITGFMTKRNIINQLENINKAGIHAAKIVDNMLSFARKDTAVKSEHCLSDLLIKSVELASSDYHLKKKYDFKNIDIIYEFDDDVPPVLCEESKIIQVFLNIFKNAAQAMLESESRIRPPQFFLRLKKEETYVAIEIEDNGPGMDEETRKRIFEPFFTTRDVKEGTGLGLSLSYYIIVDEHQGEMSVSSHPGEGTVFVIKLPVEIN